MKVINLLNPCEMWEMFLVFQMVNEENGNCIYDVMIYAAADT